MIGYWPITMQLSRHRVEGEEGESDPWRKSRIMMKCCVEEASDI